MKKHRQFGDRLEGILHTTYYTSVSILEIAALVTNKIPGKHYRVSGFIKIAIEEKRYINKDDIYYEMLRWSGFYHTHSWFRTQSLRETK